MLIEDPPWYSFRGCRGNTCVLPDVIDASPGVLSMQLHAFLLQ